MLDSKTPNLESVGPIGATKEENDTKFKSILTIVENPAE